MIKIYKYGEVKNEEIFARGTAATDVSDIVSDIIENVKKHGDKALFEYSAKFDKAELSALEVTKEEIDEAIEYVKGFGYVNDKRLAENAIYKLSERLWGKRKICYYLSGKGIGICRQLRLYRLQDYQ